MELMLFLLSDPPVEGRKDSPATREEAGSQRKPFLTATALTGSARAGPWVSPRCPYVISYGERDH